MTIGFQVTGIEEVVEKLSPRQLHGAMTDTLKELGKEAKADFNRITRTWDHKVNVEVLVDPHGPDLIVGTDDKIFNMLERGTKAHGPVRAKALAFRPSLHNKTTPGNLFSGGGGPKGPLIFRKWVKGIKARNWMPIIERRLRKKAVYVATKHIERWARR